MKKIFTLFLLVFLVLGLIQAQDVKYVSGGTARQLALGGSPTNAYLMDYTNVYINPAWAVKYSDFIYSEVGYNFNDYDASGQSVGFTYAVWKGLSVGLSVGKQEGPAFAINSYGGISGNVTNADYFVGGINNLLTAAGFSSVSSANWRPLQVYGALKIAGLTVGAAIYRVGYSATDDYTAVGDVENTKDEISIGQTGFKAGVLLDLDVMLLDASAMLRFNGATAKSTPPAPQTSREINSTGTELGVNARLFMKFSDKFSLVPMARFYTFGYEPERKQTVTAGNKLNSKPNNYGRTEIEFGVGANITVPGGRVFAGLSFESISLSNDVVSFAAPWGGATSAPDSIAMSTTKYSAKVTTLPKVSLGAEFDITSWLIGRIGYFKAFAGRTTATEAPAPAKKQESSETYDFQFCPTYGLTVSDQLLSLGLCLHFDRLSIDGYLNEAWIADGPYILSGSNSGNLGRKMFCVLSMSYSFN